MPRTIHNNFNGGEISYLLSGRIDQQRYFNSLTEMENWIPLVSGGMQVRPGTIYAGAAKFPDKAIRLMEFQFSASDQLVMEFGHLYIRFWRFNATTGLPEQVMDGGSIVELATTFRDVDLPYIQSQQSGDVVYLAGGNPAQQPTILTRISSTAWSYNPMNFLPPPTSEGKTFTGLDMTWLAPILTVPSAFFLEGDLGRLIKTNDGGVLSITSIVAPTQVQVTTINAPLSTSYASGNWWLENSPNGSYLFATTPPLALRSIVTFWTITTMGTVPSTRDTFRASDVGKYIPAMGGILQVVTVNSPTSIDAQILRPLTSYEQSGLAGAQLSECAAPGTWTMEQPIWSDALGWPSVVSLHQQRLIFANWPGSADSVRGSQIGDYLNFGPGTNDDAELQFTLATGTVVPIQWLSPDINLVAGTLTREFYLGDIDGTALSPANLPKLTPHGSAGSCGITPILLESALLFVTRGQRSIGELLFNVVTNRAEVTDLTEFSSHLTEDDLSVADRIFIGNSVQVQPVPISWYIRADGTLCGLLYRRKQQVAGWFRVTTGRNGGRDQITGSAIIQNPVSQQDQVWLAVDRGNGTYIEVMDVFPEMLISHRYLDSSITYSGPATAVLHGFDHLEGSSVVVRGKDARGVWRIYPAQTVVGGQVAGLSPTVVEAEGGLPFVATATTPPAEFPGASTIQGRPKSYGLMTVRSSNTPSLVIQGVRYPNDGYSAVSPYVIPTGLSQRREFRDFELSNIGVDRLAQVTFTQDLPMGGTVLMFTADIDVGM